jgi:hypothetical protein
MKLVTLVEIDLGMKFIIRWWIFFFHGCSLSYDYQFNYWMKHITWMKFNHEWIDLCLRMKLIVCFYIETFSVFLRTWRFRVFRVSSFVLLRRHRSWWRCCCCFCSPWERAGILLPPIAFVAGHQKRAVAISGLSYNSFNVFVRFLLVHVFFTTKTNKKVGLH